MKKQIKLIPMTYTGLSPVKVAGVSPPGNKETGKKKERIETGDVVDVPEMIARNLQHDPNWESVNMVKMKYTGPKKTAGTVPGCDEEVKPGKTAQVPEAIAHFLEKNSNWTMMELPPPPAGDREEAPPPPGDQGEGETAPPEGETENKEGGN